jgi:hypothetical protein
VKWALTAALALLVLLVLPQHAGAAAIGIAAHGSDNTALPGPPQDFTATLVSDYQVNLSWVLGVNAASTIIRAKVGEGPTSITDGYEVYNGSGLAVTDWKILNTVDEPIVYRAWSRNAVGDSTTYAEASVSGGGVGMAQALLLIPIVLIALGLTVAGYFRKDRGWPMVLVAAIAWICLPVWGFSQADSGADIYALVGYVGVIMILVCAFEPIIMRREQPPEPSLGERLEQREERLLGPRRKRRWEDQE